MSAIINPNKRGPQGEMGADSTVSGPEGPQGLQGVPGVTPRIEFYQGTTNASGLYAVTFDEPFAAPPHVDPVLINPSTEHFFRVTAVSTTGFTVHVFQRSGLSVLGITLLSLATTNVNGATVDVMVTAKS